MEKISFIEAPKQEPKYNLLPLNEYDKIIVYFSGGKDSMACILYLLDIGISPDKIELHHQDIDGGKDFFDWKSTSGYVRSFAKQFNLKLYRKHGFWGELHRYKKVTNDIYYQYEDLELNHLPSNQNNEGKTRLRFPAKTASLLSRWCSAYLKIDVGRRCINNIFPSNKDKPLKILVITGERRQESSNRAKYSEVENHPSNKESRLVHHWRCVIDWSEEEVWNIIKKYSVIPHPAYYLGFPRLSCMTCIFFSPDHWATIFDIAPGKIYQLKRLEKKFKHTIDNKKSIMAIVKSGKTMIDESNKKYIKLALNEWNESILTDNWVMPKGGMSKQSGGGSI